MWLVNLSVRISYDNIACEGDDGRNTSRMLLALRASMAMQRVTVSRLHCGIKKN